MVAFNEIPLTLLIINTHFCRTAPDFSGSAETHEKTQETMQIKYLLVMTMAPKKKILICQLQKEALQDMGTIW